MPAPSIHAFAEKVALVTDGASAVGRAVALQLALQGAYVIVGFAETSRGDQNAIEELKALGTLASSVRADAATLEGARALVDEVDKTFGRLDLLVNCLNHEPAPAFEAVDEAAFEKTIGANLKAAFFVTQQALPLMNPRPKPKIVNVGAALDTEEAARNALFAASQAALAGLTESLARALPPKFRVNAVAVSAREKNAESLDAELFRPRAGAAADDVARAVLFLLSSEAVGLNGQNLKIE